jgi:hypothetical protein
VIDFRSSLRHRAWRDRLDSVARREWREAHLCRMEPTMPDYRRSFLRTFAAVLVLSAVGASILAAQAPQGATAKCRDGTYSHAASHKGACSHHGGVDSWISPSPQSADSSRGASVAPDKGKANAGNQVRVWVNTPTMVYHCPGDRWYGTTKRGEYMTEAAARAAGARPAYGRACS